MTSAMPADNSPAATAHGTLFCTDTFWNEYGDRVHAITPNVDAGSRSPATNR